MSGEKAKTPDGRRTRVADLNTDIPQALEAREQGMVARLARAWRNVNQVLAGMYTGVGCAGDPHTHHRYPKSDKKRSD